jgi:hypothetical protein
LFPRLRAVNVPPDENGELRLAEKAKQRRRKGRPVKDGRNEIQATGENVS